MIRLITYQSRIVKGNPREYTAVSLSPTRTEGVTSLTDIIQTMIIQILIKFYKFFIYLLFFNTDDQ